jgi:hypothetical protein
MHGVKTRKPPSSSLVGSGLGGHTAASLASGGLLSFWRDPFDPRLNQRSCAITAVLAPEATWPSITAQRIELRWRTAEHRRRKSKKPQRREHSSAVAASCRAVINKARPACSPDQHVHHCDSFNFFFNTA